jgi:hypothetical protein
MELVCDLAAFDNQTFMRFRRIADCSFVGVKLSDFSID